MKNIALILSLLLTLLSLQSDHGEVSLKIKNNNDHSQVLSFTSFIDESKLTNDQVPHSTGPILYSSFLPQVWPPHIITSLYLLHREFHTHLYELYTTSGPSPPQIS